MKTLKSIIIIHDIIYRMDFAYLAELFRFLGIFVCEDILVEMDAEQILERYNSTDYDAYIFVGNREITDKEENKGLRHERSFELWLAKGMHENMRSFFRFF